MKSFNEWMKNLNESVTFQVSNVDDSQKHQDLDSLCWKLTIKMQQMFKKEFDEAKRDSVIVPDGDYYSENKEEINFYAGYFPEESREKMLKAIIYLLQEFNMKQTGPVRKDHSSMMDVQVYRIPVSFKPNQDPAPELNVANGNAVELLKMLNIENEYLHGSISITELSMKLGQITDFHLGMATRAKETGKNYVSFGLSEDQLKRYIEVLEQMVAWAIKNNYDTISYG